MSENMKPERDGGCSPTNCSLMDHYRDLGNLSSVDPAYSRQMWCDNCMVTWVGCWDNFECPECGRGELPGANFFKARDEEMATKLLRGMVLEAARIDANLMPKLPTEFWEAYRAADDFLANAEVSHAAERRCDH